MAEYITSILQIVFPLVFSAAALIMQVTRWRGGEKRKLDAETQKSSADAASQITDSAIALLPALKERVDALTKEMAELRADNARLRRTIEAQARRINELERERGSGRDDGN